MGITAALQQWRKELGEQAVVIEQSQLDQAELTNFATTQRIRAILFPTTTDQVCRCMQIANSHAVPIYPSSRGQNWGLGSRVPVTDSNVLLDLRRMTNIVDYDAKLGTITVEPGVTFRQASRFLKDQKSEYFLNVIAGPPDGSLIANALERGDAVGPLGQRVCHLCALHVVLPTGQTIRTGFDRFDNAAAARVAPWGLGPAVDGLFSQSNLGVVTQATFWLSPRPAHFQSFAFTVHRTKDLHEPLLKLRDLHLHGVIDTHSLLLWNSVKSVASGCQFPWSQMADRRPLSVEDISQLSPPWGDAEWIGFGGLYSASAAHAKADRELVAGSLENVVRRFVFVDLSDERLDTIADRSLRDVAGADIDAIVDIVPPPALFLGTPTERSLRLAYWRKKTPVPEDVDPDRDRCGLLWASSIVPFESEHVIRAVGIMTEVLQAHRYEPTVGFMFPSHRAVHLFPSVVFDREESGEDERAMRCHDEMLERLASHGYLPYRLGIHSMGFTPQSTSDYDRFVQSIKHALDPNDILAPGRYDAHTRGKPST